MTEFVTDNTRVADQVAIQVGQNNKLISNNIQDEETKPKVAITSIDLNNLQAHTRLEFLINSPRSLEAFKRTGILMHELGPVDVAGIEAMLREREKTQDIPKQLI